MDPTDTRGARLLESGGNLNPGSLALWNHALRIHEWDVVVDVGCNYGEMIVSADLPARSHIVAFEPNSTVLTYLDETLSGWSGTVELIRSAVSSRAASDVDFVRDEEWSGKSTLTPAHTHDGFRQHEPITSVHESVDVTTLDLELIDRGFATACIKIDIEGGELDALAGASEFLDSLERWVVMVEILHMTPEEIADLVRQYNLYVHDKRTKHLIRIHSETPAVIHKLLSSGWVYPQDALLIKSSDMVPQW